MFLLRDLVSSRTWLAVIHHLTGFVIGFVALSLAILGIAGVAVLPLALAGIPIIGIMLRLAGWFGAAERARFNVGLGTQIPAWPAAARAGYRWGVVPRWRTLTDRAAWAETGYLLLRLPVSSAFVTLTLCSWAFAVVMLALPAYNAALPRGGVQIGGTVLLGVPTEIASVLLGIALLLASPQLTRTLAAADVAMTRRLLGPTGNLAARITELERSRERVVDAAEAERRRIERDLHDGAQQRLVALAMELGRAKAKFTDDIDAARELVDQAHLQAKDALTELRNLVRGVHPPVLTDRGLDAALSGLAARCPVPVDVHVDVPVRPRPAVEAIAYFVVAESLTNVAKHARASHARVWVEGHGFPGSISVMVSDDGIGGANPAGAGLTGLADRVAGVDGHFTVESPAGGPTIIAAELPCG
jgi:signal transduction histidine kinase